MAGLEDGVGHDVGVLDLEEALLDDEVPAPEADDVGLHRAPWGPVRVEPRHPAVDLERRPVRAGPRPLGGGDGPRMDVSWKKSFPQKYQKIRTISGH